MTQWILGGLLVTAIVDGIIALLVIGLTRQPRQRFSLSLLLAGVSVWAFGVMEFLRADTIEQANFWAITYYIAATVIVPAAFFFCSSFPKKIHFPRFVLAAVVLAAAGIIGMIVYGDGLIVRVVVDATSSNVVELAPIKYWIYVIFYTVLGACVTAELVFGLYLAQRGKRNALTAQMQALVISIAVTLAAGMWFNLFLPLFGTYEYVWCGPLLSLLFTGTLMYVVVRQGLFDVRRALVKMLAYLFLVACLALVAWGAFGVVNWLVSERLIHVHVWTAEFSIVALLAFCAPFLKTILDRYVDRILYIGSYDNEAVLDELRHISREEVKTDVITKTSLEILSSAMRSRQASAFIRENGEWQYVQYGQKISPHRQAAQAALVENHLDHLPMAGRVHDVDQLRDSMMYSLLVRANVSAYMRLESQKKTIGVVFFGAKTNGKSYDEKDSRLLRAAAGDLSLAIESSLRFLEIEQFTATLEHKISTATKELKKSNTELQKLDTTKDEFISMASHQLRTPLTSVKGYIDMVIEGDAGKITPMQKQLLSQAFESSERMVHLIDDFLNVSRLQTGKFIVERRETDLVKLVSQEIDSLRSTATAHNLKLVFHAPRNFPTLYVDDNKIRQVVMNFIDNAIYYSPASSAIEIKLLKESGDIVFEVHDTGIGVPKAEQSGLFTKFFRAANARKQRPDGTGVGLFLAKKVIDGHHGRIIFRSAEGKGSVFGFRVPIARLKEPDQSLNK